MRRAAEAQVMPECCLCGLRCATPTSPRCPQCGHPDSFRTYLNDSRIGIRCLSCGFDLTGNLGGTCPECGEVYVGPKD